jgi:hypothetical protein
MTNRERVLAILRREMPDRIPWIPRLKLWYTAHQSAGTLPQELRGMNQREAERWLGMGDAAREGRLYRVEYRDLEVRTFRQGAEDVTEWVTPHGTLRSCRSLAPGHVALGFNAIFSEYPIKSEADYRAWEHVVEHTEYVPTYDEFLAYDAKVGAEGLPFVIGGDCPFHAWQIRLVGYEEAYLHLNDFPATVERLIERMTACEREKLWPIIAGSPAVWIQHGVHFDSMITPPAIFRKYIQPYYRDFSALLHGRGKYLAFHLDADSRLLLNEIRDAGMDVADTFATAPLVKCTLAEARRFWGDQIVIWGGLPSTLLEDPVTDSEFEREMRTIFRTVAPGRAFILGVSDNIMPGARFDRLKRLREMVAEWGECPLRG